MVIISPVQFLPSNVKAYPVLQEQIKLPTVLLQLCSHPSISREHSSISVTDMDIDYRSTDSEVE